MRGWAFRIAASLLLLIPAAAAADESADTERRLKAIGVAPELRARIHRSIDSGVRYLQRVQNPAGDGKFSFAVNPFQETGLTALCGLACKHAGTPQGTRVASKAARWLAPSGGKVRREATEDVYNLSLSLMLLSADGADRSSLMPMARQLADCQSPRYGWWGYLTFKAKGTATSQDAAEAKLDPVPNLSTTQFAGLGLWSARGRGVHVEPPRGVAGDRRKAPRSPFTSSNSDDGSGPRTCTPRHPLGAGTATPERQDRRA